MGKRDNLYEYICKCNQYIKEANVDNAKFLQQEIIGVYSDEIKNIREELDSQILHYNTAFDYIGDLHKLRAKLINYLDNIDKDVENRTYELERLRLQKFISINNSTTNNLESNATSMSSATANFELEYKHVLENIRSMSEELLNEDDKQTLEEKIDSINAALKAKDKEKLKSKIGSVLRFILDKGVDIGITLLPYLGLMAQNVQ